MESRTLEIELQYANDLNKVNLITKMDVYVIVSISGGDDNSRQKTKSPVDHNGDANPTWNFTMKFTLDEAVLQQNRLTLDFKLVCERSLGDKDIGEVNVPIKELFDSPAKGDGKQILSYQVRKPSGKTKGQLTFAYKFSEKTTAALPYAGGPVPMTSYPAGSSVTYPPPPPGMYPPPVAYPTAASSESGGHYPPPVGYPSAGVAPQTGGYPPPPPSGYGYPPPQQQGYGYPPQPGYGYPPPPPGYGYPQPVQQPPKKNKFGLGLGAGLLGGAIGGLLIGDIISDGSGCGGGCGGG